MLNENLIDPKDKQIADLKKTIKHFKKYDKERKDYYSKSLQELGALKAYVEELTETNDLVAKNKKLKEQITQLNLVIRRKGIELPEDIKDYDIMKLQDTVIEQRKRIKKLDEILKQKCNTISELIYRLNKQNGEIH